MKSLNSSLVVSVLGLVLCAPVVAQERGDWYWGVNIAGIHSEPAGDGVSSAELVNGQANYSESWRLGVQLRYFPLDNLALGISAPVLEPHRHSLFLDTGDGSVRAMNVEVAPITVSAAWYLPKWRSLRTRLIGAWQHADVSRDRYRPGSVSGVDDMSLDDYQGLGVGVGVEWDLDSFWSWDVSVVQFAFDQDLTLTTADGEQIVRTDPNIFNWSLGLSRRF